jgi:hypothetical protein
MRQQRALVALSLFDDDDAKKGVQLITQREEEGLGITSFSTASLFLCFHATQKEQICCFLTHHPGLLEEDAR